MNEIVIQNLAKQYKGLSVVKDVSLRIESGEVIGLLGPNGAGKTTCFYMIVGLELSDKGKVFLNKKNITALPVHERARLGLGYLPQEASVFRKLSVEENIMAVLELRKDLSHDIRQKKLEGLLQEFHLGHLRQQLGLRLSGGERRRVEIARCLATEPSFILLDEPFAGIDPISVMDIKNIVRHLTAKGIGVLITDHNVRETLDICTRAYIVNEGEVIAEGSPENILKNKKVRDVYLGEQFDL